MHFAYGRGPGGSLRALSALCAYALLALGGCRSTPSVTGLRVVVEWGGTMTVDQLEFSATDNKTATVVVAPERKPPEPGNILTSGADVVIYFSNDLADTDVRAQVRGYLMNRQVAEVTGTRRLDSNTVNELRLTLLPLGTGKANGVPCAAAAECQSKICADGVCCDARCDTKCRSCNQPSFLGVCRQVATGAKDPRSLCAPMPPCGQDGNCDANGNCSMQPAMTECLGSSCRDNVTSLSASRCDGMGRCVAGGPLPCAPFVCRNNACLGTCSGNSDCAPGSNCDMGSCGKKKLGQPCGGGSECESTFCFDNVCCDKDCAGACKSCATRPGTCTNTPVGTGDPRCTTQSVSTCASDGKCNGLGSCRTRYPQGTICGPPSCDSGTQVSLLQTVCGASGPCPIGMQIACSPYKCNGQQCATTCSSSSDCVSPNTCVATSCAAQKPIGAICTAASQCMTGFCVDGFCCNAACPVCKSCKIPGSVGYCTNITEGTIDSRCPLDPKTTCGFDQTCNGLGECRKYPGGTGCADPMCIGQIRSRGKSCDGVGSCAENGNQDCYPYLCTPNGPTGGPDCFTSCTSSAQCCCGRPCMGSQCRP